MTLKKTSPGLRDLLIKHFPKADIIITMYAIVDNVLIIAITRNIIRLRDTSLFKNISINRDNEKCNAAIGASAKIALFLSIVIPNAFCGPTV
jgi:hypothetical protein